MLRERIPIRRLELDGPRCTATPAGTRRFPPEAVMGKVRVNVLADYHLAVWVQAGLLLGLMPGVGIALWVGRGCPPPPPQEPSFLVLVALLAAGSVLCLAFAVRRAFTLRRLLRLGVVVTASVRGWDERNARWGTGRIELAYTCGGKEYAASLGMRVRLGRAAAARGWLPVLVDPDRPGVFTTAEPDE
jgi:hypothetical protein